MLRVFVIAGILLCLPTILEGPWPKGPMSEASASAEPFTQHGPYSQTPVGEGVVQHYVIDPRGEVEGLVLTDGSHMYVTSRAADQLLHAIKPGDRIRIYGLREGTEKLIRPDIIRNLSNGTTFIVPLRLDLPMYEQERHLSVTELQATGTIQVLLFHPTRNTVQGFVLSDGTQIRLPDDVSEDLRRSFQVGEPVSVRGNGTENQFGRSIEAVSMGKHPSRLVTLDATIRNLP